MSLGVYSLTAPRSEVGKAQTWEGGRRFLREIKAGLHDLPVIMMGHPGEYDPDKALCLSNMGAFDVVEKPMPDRRPGKRQLDTAIEIALEAAEAAKNSRKLPMSPRAHQAPSLEVEENESPDQCSPLVRPLSTNQHHPKGYLFGGVRFVPAVVRRYQVAARGCSNWPEVAE